MKARVRKSPAYAGGLRAFLIEAFQQAARREALGPRIGDTREVWVAGDGIVGLRWYNYC